MIKALKVFSVVLTESPAISPSASELGAKSADRTGAQSFLIRKCRFWLNFWYRLVLVLQRRSNHQRARSAGKTLLHSPSMPLSEVNARAAPPSQREKAEWNSTVPAELTPPTFSCRPNIYMYINHPVEHLSVSLFFRVHLIRVWTDRWDPKDPHPPPPTPPYI